MAGVNVAKITFEPLEQSVRFAKRECILADRPLIVSRRAGPTTERIRADNLIFDCQFTLVSVSHALIWFENDKVRFIDFCIIGSNLLKQRGRPCRGPSLSAHHPPPPPPPPPPPLRASYPSDKYG